MKKQNILAAIVMIMPVLLWGQAFESGKISPYTELILNMYHSEKDSKSGSLSPIQKRVQASRSNAYVHAFVELNEGWSLSELESSGLHINSILDNNIATAQIALQDIAAAAALPSVKRIEVGNPVKRKLDRARPAAFVNEVHEGLLLSKAFRGKNVVIGIVDEGFEYDHIAFYNDTGKRFRVKRVWNQNRNGNSPKGFSYGTEYSDSTSIVKASFDNLISTHGTHVAGIAAGAYRNQSLPYYGIADEADIVLVSYKRDDNTSNQASLIDAIKYVYDYAASVGKPAVVNLSLGSHIGPHDGSSLFDRAADNLQGPGKLLVGAVGNEGREEIHVEKHFLSTSDTLRTFLESYNSIDFQGFAEIWGDVDKSFNIQVALYDLKTHKYVYKTGNHTATRSQKKDYSINDTKLQVSGNVLVFTERNPGNRKANAYIYTEFQDFPKHLAVALLISSAEGKVHAWASPEETYFTNHNINGWETGNGQYSMSEVGGTGKKIISVGAYITRGHSSLLGKLASFSSQGPTTDGRLKPDVSAPGVGIIAPYSSSKKLSSESSITLKGRTYYYGRMDGTSMASPFVAGVLATWLEAAPTLTPDDVRQLLRSAAISDAQTGNIPPKGSNAWGRGKINAWEGLREMTRTSDMLIGERFVYPPSIAWNDEDLSFNFTYEDKEVELVLYDLKGVRHAQSNFESIGPNLKYRIDNHTWIPKGLYIIQVKGKRRNFAYKVYVR